MKSSIIFETPVIMNLTLMMPSTRVVGTLVIFANSHFQDFTHPNSHTQPTIIYLCICLFRKRIFVLGPAHHKYLPGCAITSLTQYQTPLYNLSVDTAGEHVFFICNIHYIEMIFDRSNVPRRRELTFNPFTPRVSYGDIKVVLTFEAVDEIIWCDHSNETSLVVLSHSTIYI